ncbi:MULTISPECIES: CaiB/BaiF CoA transferase family protein [Rhodococcus]|jgi:crotonobetainyl-CoA:carnitine CoA-transferase CaiB-like acyl-CoA transferase|uniref:CoA transferase n=1 Tax=Rhodococcus jostii TaxID=132919 RepID=A0ABU4CK46_RHOJO|nr:MULTISPECIES: CoA transferase [Rhodococcus]MDI9948504.1 CoA transferase [Rhodococcus sp. IEGM 1305]MDV6283919.1 CoA transferase [Rhodococcus jostii]
MTDTQLPLEGIRVLDLSTVLAAPVTATFLGDFGAEVVKVEEPGTGDFTRAGLGSEDGRHRSLQWVQEGRNKKSVTIDLRTECGRDLVRQLIPQFDVVVSNYRPPTLEKWGLGPETLQQLNPRAVLVFITGYGLTGPYRDRGAFDRISSAFAGLTYVSGEPDRDPVRSGYSVVDYMSAYLAAFATVTALYHRDHRGGTGQIIDLGLYEAGFRASENALLAYGAAGQIRERLGNKNLGIVPASDFDTADERRISLHAGTDPLFRKLAAVLERPDLATDPRFATRTDRVVHQDALYSIITDWVADQTADHAVKLLNDADIPAAPIMNIADIAADPHYSERGTVVTVDDEQHGVLPMAAPLPRMTGTPGRIRTLGPDLGEHTDAVLTEMLGLSGDDLARLRTDGVI